MKTTTTAPGIMVTIKILDQSGHTTLLSQRIDEAIETTFKQHYTHSKFTYTTTETGIVPFEFTANDLSDAEGLLKDTIRLRKLLEANEEPLIVVTGPLQGGTI